MIGFVYAGQGSQHPGQGKDFYEKYQAFRNAFDQTLKGAAKVTATDLKQLSFEGPEEELSLTENTQPAMGAFAAGVTALLFDAGIRPDYCMGLSLGEYNALYAAGVFPEDTLGELLSKRGRFMTEACRGREVKMAAVLGADREKVQECCRQITAHCGGEKIVECANFNCPGQTVISGDSEAVDLASEALKEAGAKRVMPVKVSGPFHTSLMKPAGEALRSLFSGMTFAEPRSRVVFNCLGTEAEAERIPELLVSQVQSPVYLEDSFRYLEKQGVDRIIEIGPGKALSKLIRRTCPDISVQSIDSAEDFERCMEGNCSA